MKSCGIETNSVSDLLHCNIMTKISHLSTSPLFSCIVTLYTLLLLYFPQAFQICLSPVLILTALFSLFVLLQTIPTQISDDKDNQETIEIKENREKKFGVSLTQSEKWVETAGFDHNPLKPGFEELFVEWNVKAPLEVIYEAYEGEEDEDDQNETRTDSGLERYPSLSMYYTETDSDSSSDDGLSVKEEWDSPETFCFRWEEEDRNGSLIEIALDHNREKNGTSLGLDMDFGFHVEEDNLIEIDISPCKKTMLFPSSWCD